MLGNNIRTIRKAKKISINKLSEETGISLGYLSDLENNKAKNPTMDKLQAIADALSVSLKQLLSSDEKLDIAADSLNKITELAKIGLGNEKIKERSSKYNVSLNVVPEEFINPEEAREYVNKHKIFASEGFDANKLSDDEILEFANALLEQMKMVSYKYRR